LLTEGRRTEVEYFAEWAKEFRDRLTIEFDPVHGSPMTLVERAVEKVDQRRRTMRRGKGDAEFDEIWCVFDRDEHPLVNEAIELAAQHEIGVAFSNPCFELWFVLHAQDLRRHTDRHEMQGLSAQLGLTAGKGLVDGIWDRLRTEWKQADERAVALDTMHLENGSPPRGNPSTTVGRLVRRLHDETTAT
jgi:hypothetical protein